MSATLNGVACAIVIPDGALCDLGQFDSGETANIQFIVNAPDSPGATATWASFKVAENVPDQGANRNTFYADAKFVVGATNTNGNATFKLANEDLTLTTDNQTLVKKDSMTTTVSVPGVTGGAISISETDCDASCDVGQIATVHVRDGADQTPNYLLWTLVVVGSIDGTVTHVLDNGQSMEISLSCSATVLTNCIVSNVKNGNVSTIVFKTPTNGRVHN